MSAPQNPRWATYPQARWRGLTPVDPQSESAVLSFDIAGGEVLRLHLSTADRRHVADVTRECLDNHRTGTTDHSDNSSGMRQCDGSIPDEGQKV
jgi:hypothetical protein